MLSVPHGEVRARVLGCGDETVVLVCDAPVFIEHYEHLITLLAKRYRVVCMELPGMGFSVPKAGFGFTLQEQAQAVEQVLRALDVSACTLAFPCVNGYLALLLARSSPELVKRVVVLQTPSWEEEKKWALAIDFGGRGWIATPYLGQLLVSSSQRTIARRWFMKALGSGVDAAQFRNIHGSARRWLRLGARLTHPSLLFATRSYLRAHLAACAGHLGHSRSDAPRDPQGFRVQYFRDAESLSFEASGHCPELEQPHLFTEHLVRFIEQR